MAEQGYLDALADAAFCRRVACYLDGAPTEAEFRTLSSELQGEGGKRVAFVRICMVRAWMLREGAVIRDVAELSNRAAADLEVLGAADPSIPPAAASLDPELSLHDAVILPAIQNAEGGADDGAEDGAEDEGETGVWTGEPGSPTAPGQQPSAGAAARWWIVGGGAAAALALLGVGLTWGKRPQPPALIPVLAQAVPWPAVVAAPAPATITATAGAVGSGIDEFRPGTALAAGQDIHLSAGALELTFARGAVVVVEAPARAEVRDPDTLELDAGRACAHVPPPAIGFRITAPGLAAVDQGTNFGVRTGPSGASAEVHVFDGRVDATGLDGRGQPTGETARVTAGQAVGHSPTAANPNVTPVPFVAAAFDRDIARIRMPVPSHGTGAGLPLGSLDPAWQIVSGPVGTTWHPGPAAVVFDPRPEYVANSPDAKWVSTTPHMINTEGGQYTYRTTLDLTGFDPATVSARATFAADDAVTDLRVNGQSVGLPAELTRDPMAGMLRTASHPVSLSGARWVTGANPVEVVVYNSTQVGLNYTGLQLGWSITASPVVHR